MSFRRLRLRLLLALGGLLLMLGVRAAPLDDVNQYADRCAAELGAGAGAYMPIGLFPNPPDFTGTVEIPTFWNQKAISFENVRTDSGKRCSDAGAGCNAGNSRFEFLFDGKAGHKAGETASGSPAPGQPAYPDGANTAGRVVSKAQLKCDFWSHVNTTNGCLPGQRAVRATVGTCRGGNEGKACSADNQCGGGGCQDQVQWSFIFRRREAPVTGAAFGPSHPYFSNNMDVVAFKKDTGAACWFDTLGAGSTTTDKWWESRVAGLPVAGPAGIPRPGGKDADKKARALAFWKTPADVGPNNTLGEKCTSCHGNGPILTSRWINAGGAFSGRLSGEIPYWHPAGLLPNPAFKKFAEGTKPAPAMTTRCSNCHDAWSTIAATSPGGTLANAMTRDSGTSALASNFRKQIDDATGLAKQGKCSGGANNNKVCTAQTDCPAGACLDGQDAGIMREMPHPFMVQAPDGRRVAGTPKDWDTLVKPGYIAMKVCLRTCAGGARVGRECRANSECPGSTCMTIDATKCDDTKPADIPKFFGAQDRDQSLPPAEQRVEAPLPVDAFKLSRANCVLAADGAETCDYQAEWQDVVPSAGDFRNNQSDYFSPDQHFLQVVAVAADQKPATKAYCLGTNTPVVATTAKLPGSNWAKKYQSSGPIAACRAVQVRVCGGYTVDAPLGATPPTGHSPIDSREAGQSADALTACAHKVQIKLGGYRLNRATQRYFQIVTLTNSDTVASLAPTVFLLRNLSGNAALANASGSTSVMQPAGTPYVEINGGSLGPGQSVSLTLEFNNPTNQAITYDARVRAGPGAL